MELEAFIKKARELVNDEDVKRTGNKTFEELLIWWRAWYEAEDMTTWAKTRDYADILVAGCKPLTLEDVGTLLDELSEEEAIEIFMDFMGKEKP